MFKDANGFTWHDPNLYAAHLEQQRSQDHWRRVVELSRVLYAHEAELPQGVRAALKEFGTVEID